MSQPYRLEQKDNERKKVHFIFNNEKMEGYEGEPIAAAILANGIKEFRTCSKTQQKRGIYCGIGHCYECRATVDGVTNVRTCLTLLKEGVQINSMDN